MKTKLLIVRLLSSDCLWRLLFPSGPSLCHSTPEHLTQRHHCQGDLSFTFFVLASCHSSRCSSMTVNGIWFPSRSGLGTIGYGSRECRISRSLRSSTWALRVSKWMTDESFHRLLIPGQAIQTNYFRWKRTHIWLCVKMSLCTEF